MTNTKTSKDFSNIRFFLSDNFDFSKCYYDADQQKSNFIVELSKLGTEAEDLIDSNLGLLLEYDDAMVDSDNDAKRVNICIYDVDTQSVIDRCGNQVIGNKHFYDRLDFIAKHLKTQNEMVRQTVEIEPNIKALYGELQKSNLYYFNILKRDNNDDRPIFSFDLHSDRIKLCGSHIEFYIKNGEKRNSAFSIYNNICKIEKTLSGEDFSDRYYYIGYNYKIYFTGSDTPLEFYASKTEYRKEV